ncbi:MAG: threonine synthase [Clostridia bacterium]|nr:threonine synthase [Clostridia bacterium]
MRFVVTRGGEKVTGFDAVIKGIAANGGLFVPEKFPKISDEEMDAMLEMGYPERVAKIVKKFFTECDEEELLSALEESYAKFDGDDPAPMVRVDDGVYMLELFHGPTCSSRDMALAPLPYLLKKATGDGKKPAVVLATSGDTGKAAFELFKDEKVLALYPHDGVSKMQKWQLVTQEGKNVDVVAVKGSFDDCQTAVKQILVNGVGDTVLTTANSINFGAVAPRIAYYFSAYLDMLSSNQIERGEEIDFYIPCSNFGTALAGYYAKLMGLPIRRIHCASNENNALGGFFKTGVFDIKRETVKTTSPSMDILNPVNIERLIFEISGHDTRLTAKRMALIESGESFCLTENELNKLNETFDGGFATEETCVEAMYDVFEDIGYAMDTCTGCAMKLVHDWYEKNKKDETKAVIVAVVSPYKYPQDVLYAMTGNDVKDSFKGVKRLHDATAMAIPKMIKDSRDKPVIFNRMVDKKNIAEEAEAFFK